MAAILLVLAGGFGYVALFDALQTQDFLTAVSRESFYNSWNRPTFQVPSVLGTAVLAHRANSFGLPLLILILWLFFRARDEKTLIVCGALAGLLFPFSFHAFFAAALLLAVFLYKERKSLKEWLAVFLPAGILAIPFLVPAILRGGAHLKIFLGWIAPKDPAGFVLFYLANFGFGFVLFLGAIPFLNMKDKHILGSGALALFLVPNLISFTAIEWDMNRFFQFMTVFTAIPAAALLSRLPKFLAALALILCVASPLLVAGWFATSDSLALTQDDLSAATWIRANTTPRDVFLTEAFINMPTDLAGRLRLLTFTPYVANYALNPTDREKDTQTAFCGTAKEAAAVMKKYGARYILYRGQQSSCSHAYRADPRFEKAFSKGLVEIYRVL